MSILDEIIEIKKEEVKKLRSEFSLSRFSDLEFFDKSCISFRDAISKSGGINIITEVKKASPSKGVIREDFNHLEIAEMYMSNGADAMSVLTDQRFFKGHISYLNDIARIKEIPLLRKDFIIDEYQVLEAKAYGADVILLIAEALSKNQITELTECASENRMDVLLELHGGEELPKINFGINKIIGINNRDLNTFNVDLKTTETHGNKIPEDIILVSESGISSEEDVEFLKGTNANAILVGEHLMRQEKPGTALNILKEWCKREN